MILGKIQFEEVTFLYLPTNYNPEENQKKLIELSKISKF